MGFRRAFVAVAVLATVLLHATGAVAAAPTNDVIAGAKAVATIPYTDTADTTEATTDADDTALNENCGAPATDASVWYVLAGAGGDLFVDVSQSDYSAGVLVGEGSPGNLTIVACGPQAVSFFAEAGKTYYLLVIDDQFDGGGNGGQLSISIDVPPPPPEINITIDPTGKFDSRTGTATISGTVTCIGENVDFASLDGQMSQRAGRVIIHGYFFSDLVCDGDTHPWSAEVSGENGLFKGGNATVTANAFACNPFSCGDDSVQQTVRLRSGK